MREGWERVTLGDQLELELDQVNVVPGSEYPIVGVLNRGRGLLWRDPVTSESTSYLRLNRVLPGRVIYRKLTAFEGTVAVTPDPLGDAFASPEFPVFRCKDGLVPSYARLLTQHPQFWEDMALISKGIGGRRGRLHPRDFLRIRVLLPLPSEQIRIVDLIGAADDAIETAENARCRAVGELYESVLASLVERFDTKTIGEVVVTARSGGTPSRQRPDFYGGGIPWLKSGEVEQDSIHGAEETITEAGLAASSAWVVPAGATLVAMYGQGETKGRAGYLSSPVATNQAVLALIPDADQVHPRYLLHAVRSRTHSLRKRAIGAAQPNLSKGLILAEPIPIPALEEQTAISAALDSLVRERDVASALAQSLRVLRSELLTALLSSEHRIPESYDDLMGA